LTPVDSRFASPQIVDHQVNVTINDGFARTEVRQTFRNPNDHDLEALYTLPLPERASLSELTIWAGETTLQGEVVENQQAEAIYEEETAKGNEAGLAQKDGYRKFDFWVYPVPAQGETAMRAVYYQPLELDAGVGSYRYPLEEGGTDEAAEQFWLRNDKVEGAFRIEVEIKSSAPLRGIRAPGFPGSESTDAEGDLVYSYASQGGDLSKDFVLNYMLEDGLPGRAEMIAYRESDDKPGTFMLTLTPGIDLQPLERGADYLFVLDVSGSMSGKLHTLVEGVRRGIGSLRPEDRFRIVAFNNRARELTRDWTPATESQVRHALETLDRLSANGGTNVYAGLELALSSLDSDRATSLVLVTDGVTNTGVVDPGRFAKLMRRYDVRMFGFLMGNSANWPLMNVICEASGGHFESVSNSDDIIGQVLFAKSKILHEAMRDVKVAIDGVKTYGLSKRDFRKVYRGEQLVLFGRYADDGPAEITLKARVSGEERVYRTKVEFPETDLLHPEIERLWAMERIAALEWEKSLGLSSASETDEAIVDLAVAYQLVTDHTSMIALTDQAFARHGIERRNAGRVAAERAAQAGRAARPARSHRVDTAQPMFQNQPAPRLPSKGGNGGGAVHPLAALGLLGALAARWIQSRQRRRAGPPAATPPALCGDGKAKALPAIAIATLGALTLAADATAETRMRRLMWTDRSASIPPLTEHSGIEPAIERFWNLPDPPRQPAAAQPHRQGPDRRGPNSACSGSHCRQERDGLDQRRSTDERRGYFGINLFNAIPLIDFVHGSVATESEDHVRGRK